jgi:hypothetical protein
LHATFSTTVAVFTAASSLAAPLHGAAWACHAANRIAAAAERVTIVQLRIRFSSVDVATAEDDCSVRAQKATAVARSAPKIAIFVIAVTDKR